MKIFNLRFTVLLTMLLICSTIYGQKNLQKAYIITLDGDTVHGFIQIKDWGMNPSRILFKISPTDEGTYYDPYDIKEFWLKNEKWQGGFVDVENSSRDDKYLSETPDLILETDLVFLQTVIDGKKPLYVYRKAVAEQYYIKTDTAFELLVYKKYKIVTKDETTPNRFQNLEEVYENLKYRGQLSDYFRDCPYIKTQISKTPYRLKSIEKLFYAYYDCIGAEYKSLKPVRNISLKFGVSAGLSLTSVHFDAYEYANVKTTNFVTFPFGISFEIGRPVSLPRWSLYNEYSYVSPYLLEDSERIENEAGYTNIFSSYKFHSGKLINTIRYNLKDDKIKLFGSLGLSTEIYRGDLKEINEGVILSTKIYKETSTFKKWRAMRMVAGVGLRYSKFTFEARFEPGNGLRYVGPATSFILNYTF